MSDMMLPQVPAAQAKPASAAPAKPAESTAESPSESGFSGVLQTRMQPEEGGSETAPATNGATPAAGEGNTPAAAGDGKPLPATGNATSVVIAALTETPETTPVADAPAADTAVALPAGIAVLFPTEHARPVTNAKPAQPQPALTQNQPRPQPGPLATGVRQELPEPAQASVAQAVREALAGTTEPATPRPAGEVFAAHVRALAAVQGRASSADGVLERLVAAPAQAQAQASAASPPVSLPSLTPDGAAGARALIPTTTLDTPFRQSGWDQALSERVVWVANQRFQGAEIKLNPPQLGPIEVRVQLQHEQAHVSFTAQHASVREALEAALPRLREMLSANGYNLVDVNVSQHSFAEQQRQAQSRAQSGNPRAGLATDDDSDTTITLQQDIARAAAAGTRGGIDLFA